MSFISIATSFKSTSFLEFISLLVMWNCGLFVLLDSSYLPDPFRFV
jgi:hypothetical protein